jgi:altronate dehydratase
MDFLGFKRADGKIGIRNHIACIPTVCCVNGIIDRLSWQVPNLTPIIHTDGCGLGIKSPFFMSTLTAMCLHANNYATILIGLGCERDNAKKIAYEIHKSSGRNIYGTIVQQDGGSENVIRDCSVTAEKLIVSAKQQQRTAMPMQHLIVAIGIERNATKADTAFAENLCHNLVEMGCTVLSVSVDAPDAEYDVEFAQAVTPCGTHVRMNGYDLDPPEMFAGMFSCGAQIGVFISGESNLLGFPNVPIVRVSTNTKMYERMGGEHGDFDVNGDSQLRSVEAVLADTKRCVLETANGRLTSFERNNYYSMLNTYRQPLPY